jgi:hypothetical protein
MVVEQQLDNAGFGAKIWNHWIGALDLAVGGSFDYHRS